MTDEFNETLNMYESSLYEKREEMGNMNKELMRLHKSIYGNTENSDISKF
ncbi:MAG: hypothetical protein WAM14_15225 [Candidatus Nitrosopolaris sp.]